MMRVGGMASFMSDPFISGFTTGAACHVFSSQIKHIFGVHVHYYHGPLALVYVSFLCEDRATISRCFNIQFESL